MTPKTTARTKSRSKAAVKATAPAVPTAVPPLAETLAEGERACPTRVDGATPLFQHRLTVSQCQSKQRGLYHKCFSCAHSNARR